jgi:hypothetical protein
MPQGGGGKSDFKSDNSALLGYCAARSGNTLPTFRDKLSVPSSGVKNLAFLNFDDGTERSSRNVGKVLPLLAALTFQKGAVLI